MNNSDLPDGLKKLTREALFYPGIEEQKRIYITVSKVVGTVAKFAIQQSPYAVPDNLEIVCQKLNDALLNLEFVKRTALPSDSSVFFTVEFSDCSAVSCLEKVLTATLRTIPEYLAWNERKNGNKAPLQFTSRYDAPSDPDDSFIDLGALERNVAMNIVQHYIIESRDGYVMTDDGPVKFTQQTITQ
jgi:hypothetical protein